MFDFSSWRVRTRLTVGFGVVCVLLVVSVLMGLMAMSRMGADLKAVVADHFPRIVASANVLTQADAIAVALKHGIRVKDLDYVQHLTGSFLSSKVCPLHHCEWSRLLIQMAQHRTSQSQTDLQMHWQMHCPFPRKHTNHRHFRPTH